MDKYFEYRLEDVHFYATEAEAEANLESYHGIGDEYTEVTFEEMFRPVDLSEIELDDIVWGDTTDQTKQRMTVAINATRRIAEREAEQELLSVRTASEIASIFRLDDSTVKKAAQDGRIRARKSGGTWLIRYADAEKIWGKKR